MESMEEDGFGVSDDHNHNYCAPGGDVRKTDVKKSQLTDVTSSFPQPLPYLPARRQEHREEIYPKASNNSQLMDSDSSSEGSEVCESDHSPASSASGADKISTKSTSKFHIQNKFYIEAKLNRDLGEELIKWFADFVAEKHVKTLMPLLTRAHSMPFQVQPSTMANVVKGLYSLRPEWAQLAPALFSGFIPQIHPPAVVSQLPDYAAHDQKMQLELSMNGFPR
ncbi:hypothetical protein NHX12_022331 [Muraenolepis orangiensis]|uniref:Uncharacterized protein n=1 Tax=Muraenolepis orangiensis TaxID=630683 RepID=A0A9Q0EMC6_9TELE|nr:hypothetical protein NHX12_022331 [Muraenolepis orangiensis]